MSDQGYGWDDQVKADEGGFVLLPIGPARFEVLSMTRARRQVGDLGVVNVADMKLLCTADNGQEATVETGLPLHPKFAWKITQFFTAIGQRKHGDTGDFRPDWTKVSGASGRCKIGHRTFTGKKTGKEMTANQVDGFMTEDEAPAPTGEKTLGF